MIFFYISMKSQLLALYLIDYQINLNSIFLNEMLAKQN